MSIAANFKSLNEKVAAAARAAHRSLSEVKLLAVSKTFSVEAVREAYAAGARFFAENYAQEAVAKVAALQDFSSVEWHFIGQLQSNKVKIIADQFAYVQTVDREKIGAEISKRSMRTQKILIEVNLVGEASKGGCTPTDLPRLLSHLQKLERLELNGLMFMAPLDLTPDEQRRFYSQARELRDTMAAYVSGPHRLRELSMGTSHDFEAAIHEGATMVRVGSALFGTRG